MNRPLESNASVAIVTRKDPEGLEIIRHSTAHLLAQAIKELHPKAQITIGPVIENGFYYDFQIERPISEDDFPAIEAEMARIIDADEPFERVEKQGRSAIGNAKWHFTTYLIPISKLKNHQTKKIQE